MISKNKINLQLSIKKEDLQRLEEITKMLEKRFSVELTKSQAVSYLIKRFNLESEHLKKNNNKPIKKDSQEVNFFKPKNTALEPINNQFVREESKRKLNLLRDTLNLTNKELSELLNINFETLRKYIQGKRLPTGENQIKIQELYLKHNIK